MGAVYEIQGLTKVYKGSVHKANDNLTFSIMGGEIFGLLGPNGAGKSTLVTQLAGLVRPTSGAIRLFGMDAVARPDLIADYVAIQPQNSSALWDLYPEEAIYYTGRFRGLGDREARRQTDRLMEELGLDKLRRKALRQLSGGQRRLFILAVAFVGHRPVQVFDEPTNDLDPEVRRLVWDKLLELNRQGTTIMMIGKIGWGRQNREFDYWAGLPVGKLSLILAMLLVYLLFTLPGVAAVFLIGSWMLGLPLGAGPLLLPLALLSAVSLSGLGAFIGTCARDGQMANVLGNLLIGLVVFLSPTMIPLSAMPAPIRALSYISPITYAADAFRSLLAGETGPSFWLHVGLLALFSAFFLLLVHKKLDWRHS